MRSAPPTLSKANARRCGTGTRRWLLAAALVSLAGPADRTGRAADASAQPPAAAREEPAAAQAPTEKEKSRIVELVNGAPFDLVYVKRHNEPYRVVPLPRPFRKASVRGGQAVPLRLSRPKQAVGPAFEVKGEDITRVELFEELLAREGDRALERRDFAAAFDAYARLVQFNPQWPDARDKLHRVFLNQAEDALTRDPPDYDNAIQLGLRLRAEDRSIGGIQSLLRRALLGRARLAIDVKDYTIAREQIAQMLKYYPGDADAGQLEKQLRNQAGALVEQARQAMAGALAEQRNAVGLLAEARQIWPDLPDLEELLRRAKRNYPVLRVAVFDAPGTFEPLTARSLTEWQACQLLFDALFEPDESGAQFVRGPLLRKWSATNLGRSHQLLLEPEQHWSDGRPVTAYDLEASFRLLLDPRCENYDPERARYIQDVTATDPYTLSIQTLPHPRPDSLFSIPILPKHLLAEPPKRGSPFSRSPVGTGPFTLGAADSSAPTRFVANPQFRGARAGQPLIKEILLEHYVKPDAAVRDMETRKTHLMTRLDPLEVILFGKRAGQFEVRSYLSNSVYLLAINHRRKPLDDIRARRAIQAAIDRQAILTQYFQAGPGGLAHRVITGPFPTHSPAYNTEVPIPERKESLARQLVNELKAAELLLDRPLTLKYPLGDAPVEKAASQMRRYIEAAGFQVKTEAKIEADLRHEVVDEQDFDLAYWRYDHRNVLYNIAPLFDPQQTQPGGTNFMGYHQPGLTKLFNELRREQRPLDIWSIQREIHRYLSDEVVFVPLWQLDNYIAYTSKLVYRDPTTGSQARQIPIHPLYLFRRTEGWYLEP
jgi:peptide/nickel transport system substrate-binding protein